MSAFNVLKPNHFMMGIDLHNALIPPDPDPIPFMPHNVVAPLEGYVGAKTVKKAAKTNAEFVPMLQRGTDIGQVIPHVGVNALLPFVIANSASKSYFGAGTVKLEGTATAVAVLQTANINLNCGDPPLPTGYVFAPCTVRAGMTLGDLLAGLAQMAVESAITWGINTGINALMEPFGSVAGGIMGTLLGWAIGTPLGYSFDNSLLGPVFGKIDQGHDAIADYYNDPSRRVFL